MITRGFDPSVSGSIGRKPNGMSTAVKGDVRSLIRITGPRIGNRAKAGIEFFYKSAIPECIVRIIAFSCDADLTRRE